MKLHQNVLLSFTGEAWVADAVTAGVGLVSRLADRVTLIPQIYINTSLGQSATINNRLKESKRAKVAKDLGWDMWFDDVLIDQIAAKKLSDDPSMFAFQCWSTEGADTRRLYNDLVSWSAQLVKSANHKGYGGVSRKVHSVLKGEIYSNYKIKQPSYDNRSKYDQLVDLVFSILLVQYMNWANGYKNTYSNLLQCYLKINGYPSDYTFRNTSWSDVTSKPQIGRLRVSSIDSKNPVPNFSWAELTYSNTARVNKLPNVPNATQRKNLIELAGLLQVIRDWHGTSMHINSGFRAPAVNKKAGGVAGSAHTSGFAADIQFTGVKTGKSNQLAFARKIGQMLKSVGVKFDQIIAYETFIHIAVRRPNGAQRGEVFSDKQRNSTIRIFK